MSRRNFNAEFKTKVVLEALKEVNTLAEIAKKYKLNPQQIATWKKEFCRALLQFSTKAKPLLPNRKPSLKKTG